MAHSPENDGWQEDYEPIEHKIEGLPQGMRVKSVKREPLGDHYGFWGEQWIATLEPISEAPAEQEKR